MLKKSRQVLHKFLLEVGSTTIQLLCCVSTHNAVWKQPEYAAFDVQQQPSSAAQHCLHCSSQLQCIEVSSAVDCSHEQIPALMQHLPMQPAICAGYQNAEGPLPRVGRCLVVWAALQLQKSAPKSAFFLVSFVCLEIEFGPLST